jgi:hypothetical protein
MSSRDAHTDSTAPFRHFAAIASTNTILMAWRDALVLIVSGFRDHSAVLQEHHKRQTQLEAARSSLRVLVGRVPYMVHSRESDDPFVSISELNLALGEATKQSEGIAALERHMAVHGVEK